MFAKEFAPLLPHRLRPAAKFAQLRVRAELHGNITHRRQCRVPLDIFTAPSVDFALREIAPGQVVELRRENNQLIGLGFFEPQLSRVDVFELTPRALPGTLPLISEDFFLARLTQASERRRSVLLHLRNNAYRVVNGYADGLPSLYIDLFSESYARIIATSAGAERLVPCVTEFLRRRGAEEVLLDTPLLGDGLRLTLHTPTMELSRTYMEAGVRYPWLPLSMHARTIQNGFLFHSGQRRARLMLRDLSRGKRVLCVYDRSGGAALNATMTADKVVVVVPEAEQVAWLQANMIDNHSAHVLDTCHIVCAGASALDGLPQQDVVYLEHHPLLLATPRQWGATVTQLMRRQIIGPGTILLVCQETSPLGIADMAPRWRAYRDASPKAWGMFDAEPVDATGSNANSTSRRRTEHEQDGKVQHYSNNNTHGHTTYSQQATWEPDNAGSAMRGAYSMSASAAAATRRELAEVLRDSSASCDLCVRFLRAFAISCDYPQLPIEKPLSFAQAFLIDSSFEKRQ